MKHIMYFSKVNLKSDEVYSLAIDPAARLDMTNAVLSSLRNNYIFQEEKSYMDKEGKENTEIVDYQLSVRNKEEYSIEGFLYRKSFLFVKRRREGTDEIQSIPVDNTEDIHFYYDVYNEFVAFIPRRRFGFQMFNAAFSKLLNDSMKNEKNNYRFYVEPYNEGVTIEEIKRIVCEAKDIVELIIAYHPVNPDEAIIKKARENLYKEKLLEANATERSVIYKAIGDSCIEGNSEVIKNDIEHLEEMNPGFDMRELTKRGYLSVRLKKKTGEISSTAETKPYKKVYDSYLEFADVAKEGILGILRRNIADD